MKIKDYKCKSCKGSDFFLRPRTVFYGLDAVEVVWWGIYCTYCGRWLKWADKHEKNLFTK